MSSSTWIALAVAGIGVGLLIWRLSEKGEQEIRTKLDELAADDVARWLSRKLDYSKRKIFEALLSDTPPSELRQKYHEHIDAVILEFERSNTSDYQMAVCIESNEETVSRTERELTLDELPSPVQEAFLEGDSDFHTPWFPTFDKSSHQSNSQ